MPEKAQVRKTILQVTITNNFKTALSQSTTGTTYGMFRTGTI
jgi:hypothetical protein